MKRQLFLVIFISSFMFSHNIKATDTQLLNKFPHSTNNLFDVVRKELNNPIYAQEILPNDFTSLNQLLIYGNETDQSHTYIRSTFDIYSKILGGAEYVSAHAFTNLITELPHLLKPHFIAYKIQKFTPPSMSLDADMYDRFKESINNMLYLQFSSQYEEFKSNPDQFLHDISQQIVDITQEELNIERMRYSVLRFIDIGLSKLIWNTEKHETIWPNVKTIAEQLELLVQENIIEDMNDLDNSFWTLVHRFNYFIDVISIDLPSSFYRNILQDIHTQDLLLLNLEEQDTCIRSKKECLMHVLRDAETKSHAFEKGIIIA